MTSRLSLGLALLIAGCAGARLMPASTPAIAELWGELSDGAAEPENCSEPFGTDFSDFGLRGLACTANSARPLGNVAEAAGVPVFVSGPHAPRAAGLGLNLDSRTFGHYNPAFIAWAVENGIPGENSAAARMATQSFYDVHVARIARVYWLVHSGLIADGYPGRVPVGPLKDYQVFLGGGPIGAGADEYNSGFSMYAFSDRSAHIPAALGIGEDDQTYYFALYEANTATGFWLRRADDGTQAALRDGLRRLLTTYDAGWLATHPA